MDEHKGSVISFHDVHYTVQVRPAGKMFGKKEPKEIIKGVNGVFKPGLNAILGPTGSGKTSLLDVLAGRKNPKGQSGTLLIDGAKQPKNFKCMAGYVVQDDVVMGTLTVRENFMFSANVRLPTSISKEEKEDRVTQIIEELGLTHCADTKVGTEFIRGISGGERKRTNIGMELIISPSVLFLDEPTTGLDASTANAVIGILRRLGKKGRTIILSIHQPRFSIYRMFDRLMLLHLGRTVYHGAADEALTFFSSIGYTCEEHNNPPDFFLDVINGDSTAVKGLDKKLESAQRSEIDSIEEARNKQNKVSSEKMMNGHSAIEMEEGIDRQQGEEQDEEEEEQMADKLHQQFIDSQWNNQLESELKPLLDKFQNNQNQTEVVKGDYATGFLTQFKYVAIRTTKNSIRNPQTTFLQLFVIILFALLVGILYLDVSNYVPDGLQNRVGAFFFIIMNQIFGNLASVELFIKERHIFIHENGSGFYRVSAYFLSKVLCDVIPLRCIPAIVFSLIVYFMIGLVPEADKFFLFMVCLMLTTFTASGVGFFISAAVNVFAIANLLVALCFVFMMVFGGVLVNIDSIWAGLRWLQYLSVFRYSLSFLAINELKGQEYFMLVNDTEIPVGKAGEEYMRDIGIAFETDWDFYGNLFALACLVLGFLTLAYIMLRRVPKWK